MESSAIGGASDTRFFNACCSLGSVDSRITTTGKVIALFGLLGIGVGLASFIDINEMTTAGSNGEQNMGEAFAAAIVILQSVGFLYFIGPAMATITAILSSRTETRLYSALTNGVGSFIGYYVMFLLAFLIMQVAFPEGSGDETTSTDLSRNLVLMVKIGIPTGLIGAAAGFLSVTD